MAVPKLFVAPMIAAVSSAASPLAAAEQLCEACVAVLEVDGASLSMVHDNTLRGTFGASDETSRRLDDLQFTMGEGPCLDAVATGRAVLAADLDDPSDDRWPAFREAVLASGVRALFAIPVSLASERVGALDLYRRTAGPLSADGLAGGRFAAGLAAAPLLDLAAGVDGEDAAQDGWEQLQSLERVEVYQATGMIVGAHDVDPVEALVRLRAYAYARGRTASEVAYAIVDGRLSLDDGDWQNSREA